VAASFGIATAAVASFAQRLGIGGLQIDEAIDGCCIDVAILAAALAPVRTALRVGSEWQEQEPAQH
jgi:hypothetical protein